MFVIMLVRQDDLVGFDRVENLLEVFGCKILPAIHPTKILGKVGISHPLLRFQIRIVLIRVEHNNGVCQDICAVFVFNTFGYRAFAIMLTEHSYDSLDQGRFAW
jgi:hypothetical protein